MEIQDVLKKLEILIEETDKEIYERGDVDMSDVPEMHTTDATALLDNVWLHGYLKCARDLKLEIEEELNND